MRRIILFPLMAVVFIACTTDVTPTQTLEPSTSLTESAPSSDSSAASGTSDPRFARLKEALFQQPLPNDLHLIVLTAVEQEAGGVIEMIEPSLTNADEETGLVVTYALSPLGTDQDAIFQEAMDQLEESPEAHLVDIDTTETTKCLIAQDGGHCITQGEGYFIQSSYLPGQNLDDMEALMTEIVNAAIVHYETNA